MYVHELSQLVKQHGALVAKVVCNCAARFGSYYVTIQFGDLLREAVNLRDPHDYLVIGVRANLFESAVDVVEALCQDRRRGYQAGAQGLLFGVVGQCLDGTEELVHERAQADLARLLKDVLDTEEEIALDAEFQEVLRFILENAVEKPVSYPKNVGYRDAST
jgi:hypothetical protein